MKLKYNNPQKKVSAWGSVLVIGKSILNILWIFTLFILEQTGLGFSKVFKVAANISAKYPRVSGLGVVIVLIFLFKSISLNDLPEIQSIPGFTQKSHSGMKLTKEGAVFGIDISQNQGDIDWEKLENSNRPISFVIMRATMGIDGEDTRFKEYLAAARAKKYILGMYHYYRPDEGSEQQAQNFINSVELKQGDFVPVLDIEAVPEEQTIDRLRVGLKNYLRIIEEHYGVTPMIYTGLSFYKDHLKEYGFDRYPMWISAYTPKRRSDLDIVTAVMHQFEENIQIEDAIPDNTVDGNDLRDLSSLKKIIIGYDNDTTLALK